MILSEVDMAYKYQKHTPFIAIRDLVTIHYYELDANYRFAGEAHPFWELVYVDDGSVHVRNGEDDRILHSGEICFHAPDVPHLAEGTGREKGYVFIISFTSSSPAMELFRDRVLALPSELRSLISAIISEAFAFYDMQTDGLSPLCNAPKGGDQMICLYLEQLLILLYRHCTAQTAPLPEDLPGEIILYLNSRVYGSLSLTELCEKMHYCKTYLSQIFLKHTGMSVMQYYRRLKIAEAKRLLRESRYSVAEIAMRLQYETPQYFSFAFKRAVGVPPGEYRKTCRP